MTFLNFLVPTPAEGTAKSRENERGKWQIGVLTRQSRQGKKVLSCQKSLRWASNKHLAAERSECNLKQSAEQLDVQKTNYESGSIVARKTNPFSRYRLKKLSCTILCEDHNSIQAKSEKKREPNVISSPALPLSCDTHDQKIGLGNDSRYSC